VLEKLADAGLSPQAARSYAGPRRLTLVLDGLPTEQADRTEEKKGPKVGAPEGAINGFLKSAGLASLEECEIRDDKKGAFYVALVLHKGRKTGDVVAEIIPGIIRAFPWPKSMRWGAGELRWVRPLHSILCVFDGHVVPFEVDGLKSGNGTRGHRFHAPKAFAVAGFKDYAAKLADARVILDAGDRKAAILSTAHALAKEAGGVLVEDEGLLNEVAGLAEWPVVLRGRIDEALVRPIGEGGLPPEVLTTAMRTHQKYFSVRDPKSGLLKPVFIFVAALEAKDGGKAIIAGNERVLRARLADAKFFWDQDRKVRLEDRLPALENIVFHAKLGTVAQKVERVAALAGEIAANIGADPEAAKRAAVLAKADLTTQMVGEFPELQGLMGRYYAREQRESEDVANAIADHYKPLGPSDDVPKEPVSIAVALADKIDILAGFWVVDERPTGSKDPFALRRAALGVIRLVLENSMQLKLERAIGHAALLQLENPAGIQGGLPPDEVKRDLLAFLADRLKVALKEQGVRHDLIDAVFALGGEDDLVRLVARVQALQNFLGTEDGANLLAGYKRAANILRIEEKKDGRSYDARPDPDLFELAEEKDLFVAIATENAIIEAELEHERFEEAMRVMARLRNHVDKFFEKVTVNSDNKEVRENRLYLLSQIKATLHRIADFSRIEG